MFKTKRKFIEQGDVWLVEYWGEGETELKYTETLTRDQYNEYMERIKSPEYKLMIQGAGIFADYVQKAMETNPGMNETELNQLVYASQIDTAIELITTNPGFTSLPIDFKLEFLNQLIGEARKRKHHIFYRKDRKKWEHIEASIEVIRDGIIRDKSRDVGKENFIKGLKENGFFNLEKVKVLTSEQQSKLIEEIRTHPGYMGVAFFEYLNLFKSEMYPSFEYYYQAHEIIGGLLNIGGTSVKRNLNSLRSNKKTAKTLKIIELVRTKYETIRQ